MMHDILSMRLIVFVEFSKIEHNVRSKKNCNHRRGSGWPLATTADVGSKSTFVTVIFCRDRVHLKDEVLYLPRRNT
jgi:hypothetical protein